MYEQGNITVTAFDSTKADAHFNYLKQIGIYFATNGIARLAVLSGECLAPLVLTPGS